MLDKIKEIAESWIIAAKPTDAQKKLAEERYKICLGCEEYREKRLITGDVYCNECGCPLNKKIFSPKNNECPFKKWKEVDDLYWESTQKKDKSLL